MDAAGVMQTVKTLTFYVGTFPTVGKHHAKHVMNTTACYRLFSVCGCL